MSEINGTENKTMDVKVDGRKNRVMGTAGLSVGDRKRLAKEARNAVAGGMRVDDVAAVLGIDVRTVRRWCYDMLSKRRVQEKLERLADMAQAKAQPLAQLPLETPVVETPVVRVETAKLIKGRQPLLVSETAHKWVTGVAQLQDITAGEVVDRLVNYAKRVGFIGGKA